MEQEVLSTLIPQHGAVSRVKACWFFGGAGVPAGPSNDRYGGQSPQKKIP